MRTRKNAPVVWTEEVVWTKRKAARKPPFRELGRKDVPITNVRCPSGHREAFPLSGTHPQADRYGSQFFRHWITSFRLLLPEAQYGECCGERNPVPTLLPVTRLHQRENSGADKATVEAGFNERTDPDHAKQGV